MNLTLSHIKINRNIKCYRLITIILCCLCISACQNNQYSANGIIAANTVNLGQYYLYLKNLSPSELQKEIDQQRLKKTEGSIEAEINLMLLYSLPNSPIHNVYTAKSQLNKQLKTHENYYLSPESQAFIRLLKDQLNQQLFLFQKLINQELAHDKQMAKHRISDKKHRNKIAALELTVTQLTKQITQLKKIEQTISDHGQ